MNTPLNKKSFGAELEEYRKRAEKKQSQLFVNERYWRDIIAGRKRPQKSTILALLTDEKRGFGLRDVSEINAFLRRHALEELNKKEIESYKLTISVALQTELETPSYVPEPIITHGLVAFYELAGNADDRSGNENHGCGIGAVRYVAQNDLRAASFDGFTAYIHIPDSPSLRLEAFTLSAWVNPSVIEGGNRVVEKGDSNSYWLDVNPDGKALVGFRNRWYPYNAVAPEPLVLNSWHFLAGTHDGSTLAIYVNASLARSIGVGLFPDQNSEPLLIGWKYSGIVLDHFAGLLGGIRLYNRALTPEEIRTLYEATAERYRGGHPTYDSPSTKLR